MTRTAMNLTAGADSAKRAADSAEQAGISPCVVEHSYEPRPTRFANVRELAGWRLRAHEITLPGEALDQGEFERGLDLAKLALPQPPNASGRFGVGFVICHQGRGMDYIVLCWWARENELPMRLLVREQRPGAPWRAAAAEESICVWDIELIKRERDLYVSTVLSRTGEPDVDRYLRG